MEIEVPLPEMTKQNRHNRIYEKELDVGQSAPVTFGIPDSFDTPLVDVVGQATVIEDNNLRIKFIGDQDGLISDLITGITTVVPRGAGRVIKEDHLNYVKGFVLKDFNIILADRSSYR
jgi:hypothetical protein